MLELVFRPTESYEDLLKGALSISTKHMESWG